MHERNCEYARKKFFDFISQAFLKLELTQLQSRTYDKKLITDDLVSEVIKFCHNYSIIKLKEIIALLKDRYILLYKQEEFFKKINADDLNLEINLEKLEMEKNEISLIEIGEKLNRRPENYELLQGFSADQILLINQCLDTVTSVGVSYSDNIEFENIFGKEKFNQISQFFLANKIALSIFYAILFEPNNSLFIKSLMDSVLTMEDKKCVILGLVYIMHSNPQQFKQWEVALDKIFSLADEDNLQVFFPKISLPNFMISVLTCLICPHAIYQNGSTCGMVVLLEYLIDSAPEQFAELAVNIYQQGRSYIPFLIYVNLFENLEVHDIINQILSAMRHSLNKSISYCSQYPDVLENIAGSTQGHEIESAIKYMGGKVFTNTLVLLPGVVPAPRWFRFFLGENIFKTAKQQSIPQSTLNYLEECMGRGDFCIVQISSSLAKKLSLAVIKYRKAYMGVYTGRINLREKLKFSYGDDPEKNDLPAREDLLGFDYTHYVVVEAIWRTTYNPAMINLTIHSYGERIKISMSENFFNDHVSGCLSASKEFNQELECSAPIGRTIYR